MERIAHIVFLIIMCAIFMRVASATRAYGIELRDLRRRCRSILDAYKTSGSFPENEHFYVVIENSTRKILHSNDDNYDKEELVRLMKEAEAEKVIFQHAPDMYNTSHIIATYKETDDDISCFTFVNT